MVFGADLGSTTGVGAIWVSSDVPFMLVVSDQYDAPESEATLYPSGTSPRVSVDSLRRTGRLCWEPESSMVTNLADDPPEGQVRR